MQCYGFISLLYNNSDEQLVNSKNRLKFNVIKNIQKVFLTLQLEDFLTPKNVETTDSKIKNFWILRGETKSMRIVDEIKIEGLQNFEQYKKLILSIHITDPEIQTKLMFYSKRNKYRFMTNSLLFSSSITEEPKLFSLRQMV